jgi:hypothetical protein
MATAFGRTLTNVAKARVTITSLVSIVEKRTVVRARDLYRSGIHPEALSRALQRGLFLKIGRGLYARKDFCGGDAVHWLSFYPGGSRVFA